MVKRMIMVKTNFIGFHKWDNAPKEVAFLRDIHRHEFYVKLSLSVLHNDRELEFFRTKELLDGYIKENLQCDSYSLLRESDLVGSCEMIATRILDFFAKIEKGRKIIVEVWEDNENGALVENEVYNEI